MSAFGEHLEIIRDIIVPLFCHSLVITRRTVEKPHAICFELMEEREKKGWSLSFFFVFCLFCPS